MQKLRYIFYTTCVMKNDDFQSKVTSSSASLNQKQRAKHDRHNRTVIITCIVTVLRIKVLRESS